MLRAYKIFKCYSSTYIPTINYRYYIKETIKNRWNVENLELLEEVSVENLSGLRLQHPFDERTVPVLLGEHVTTENGTGSVHTAPAHGLEDFQLGKENDFSSNE